MLTNRTTLMNAGAVERTNGRRTQDPPLLHKIFEEQAGLRPDAVAVEEGDARVTYAMLEANANRLARRLRSLGIGRGKLAAILLPRSADAYAAMLAVLKTGAAYVPLDPDHPSARITHILSDSGAAAVITTAKLAARCRAFTGTRVLLDDPRRSVFSDRAERFLPGEIRCTPTDLCYVIYTSGSTGRPKGVMIEHRNAAHLVRTEGRIFAVTPSDRVYQGFSLAFDASVEEIWLAFNAGATLVVSPPAARSPDVSQLLDDLGVTVLSCVPTLLSMMEREVRSVRLLILGGEACPDHIVKRWARPSRRIVNTYGPTETTVIATCAEVTPGVPMTIGRPIAGVRVDILDDRLRPVEPGEFGEICIAGKGVGRGYIGMPEETSRRFLPDPFALPGDAGARIYRTGDLGRLSARGEIEFAGRADDQVKLRGYRIELAEIESAMLDDEGVLAAACAVRTEEAGGERLVGFVVPRNGGVDARRMRGSLREKLPEFMVPSSIEEIDALPTLPGGKLDRSALGKHLPHGTKGKPPADPLERTVWNVWRALFAPAAVTTHDDFFLDLGGHSLLAARAVSELRRADAFRKISITDIYTYPTIEKLAGSFARRKDGREGPAPAVRQETAASHAKASSHATAGIVQATGLLIVYAFRALHWVTPWLAYYILRMKGASIIAATGWAVGAAAAVLPALLGLTVAAKWLIVGRYREGRYPLWGAYYLRVWFVRSLVDALPLGALAGTPLLPMVYRLFGARIGQNVHLDTDRLAAFDLISIGEGSSIDETVSLLGCTVEDGSLVIGPIAIGKDCHVGTESALREGCVMEEGSRLEDLSLLTPRTRVPAGETWGGSPARPVARGCAMPPRAPFHSMATTIVLALLALMIPVVPLAGFIPGIVLLAGVDPLASPIKWLALTPLAGLLFVVCYTAAIAAAKKLLVGRVRAGAYRVSGWFYVRFWIVNRLLADSLDLVGSLRATLWLAPWLRALGARIGRHVELSTATSISPDLISVEDECTVADEASLGAPHIEGGWMILSPTTLKRRSFVGNGGVVPQGIALGEESLVGVLSIAPREPSEAALTAASWLGSPPIKLPRREASAPYADSRTYRPGKLRWCARGAFEMLRITLPPAGFIVAATLVLDAVLAVRASAGTAAAVIAIPVAYAAACALIGIGTAAAKWLFMGRFSAFERPLWSFFVWRLELANALYEFLATPLLLEPLHGTPFLPWYYRLMGARIGRRNYFHTTGLIEFDLVETGDDAAVNEDAVLQSHLFEDRILKAAPLRVGSGCSIGAGAVILYDAVMEPGSRLNAVSLLMKGERLPSATGWSGSPAQPDK